MRHEAVHLTLVEAWLATLNEGNSQRAWDLFAERYRPLMLATIRHLVTDREDMMDAFATVCEKFCANDFARLRSYRSDSPTRAKVSTWLVVVVRNIVIDWLRQRDGRRVANVPSGLSSLQQKIFSLTCSGGHSHVEAYELLRSEIDPPITFGEFLREVTTTNRVAPCPGHVQRPRAGIDIVPLDFAAPTIDIAATPELVKIMANALANLPDDVRLAVQLSVIDGVPAARVATIVGWPNAKAVYNRVSRTLAALRADFEARNLRREDLG